MSEDRVEDGLVEDLAKQTNLPLEMVRAFMPTPGLGPSSDHRRMETVWRGVDLASGPDFTVDVAVIDGWKWSACFDV